MKRGEEANHGYSGFYLSAIYYLNASFPLIAEWWHYFNNWRVYPLSTRSEFRCTPSRALNGLNGLLQIWCDDSFEIMSHMPYAGLKYHSNAVKKKISLTQNMWNEEVLKMLGERRTIEEETRVLFPKWLIIKRYNLNYGWRKRGWGRMQLLIVLRYMNVQYKTENKSQNHDEWKEFNMSSRTCQSPRMLILILIFNNTVSLRNSLIILSLLLDCLIQVIKN